MAGHESTARARDRDAREDTTRHPEHTEPLIAQLATIFPHQDETSSRIALAIYRLLARQDRATPSEIAGRAGVKPDDVAARLDEWPAVYRDEEGAVIGFWGLTGREMGHRIAIDGRDRFAWCAWDTLFLPELVGATAEVTSVTPVDGREIRLRITPRDLEVVAPRNARLFVSFRLPGEDDWQDDVVASFCHHVFFVLEEEADRWRAANPDSLLLDLESAFRAGRLKNRLQFPTLATPAA